MTICLLKTILSAGELKMPRRKWKTATSVYEKMYWNMMMLLISSGELFTASAPKYSWERTCRKQLKV
jgi:hypothetical protein